MNIRLVLCIIMGVFTAHIGIFMLIAQFKPKPKLVAPLKPNFSAKAYAIIDEETGEKAVYREITVSTKFSPAAATPPPDKPAIAETIQDETAAPRP